MKFGSVAFFKRLIVAGFALLVLVPLVLAIVFGLLFATEKGRANQLAETNLAMQSQLSGGTADTPLQTPPALRTQAPPAAGTQAAPQLDPSFDYQLLYPDMYALRPQPVTPTEKTCYLTFDDGPSANTLRILNILAEHDIKATFFVTGEAALQNPEILRAAADAGHTIGVHSWCHEYSTIYASVEAFLEDFERMYREILEITGTAPTVFRFAGGSINNHNLYTYHTIVAEMLRRGFVFYDWNAAGSDAVVGGLSSAEVTANVLGSAAGRDSAVVLLHDRLDNASTVAALPSIIRGLREQGFAFAPLTPDVKPVTFYYQE